MFDGLSDLIKIANDRLQLGEYELTLEQLALGLLLALFITTLVWGLWGLWRWLFNRPVMLSTIWQPPYATVPPMDPNSDAGRRQAWQTHAQTSALLAVPYEGNLHPTKRLLGADGRNLSNWRIIGIRLSQYDQYGRVSRSQVYLRPSVLRRLEGLARRSHRLSYERLQRQLTPIIRRMLKEFGKKLNRKNASLPIAIDIRFEGKHGEVQIVFELHQFQQNAWRRLDQWQPEMWLTQATMQENFTYALYGKMGEESLRDFKRRLHNQLLSHFATMLYEPSSPTPSSGDADSDTGTSPTMTMP